MSATRNALELAQALIRCPSVTPEDGGALHTLQAALEELGFTCHRLPFSEAGTPDIDNLYARIGRGEPHLAFAGHTDVVPVGDVSGWTVDPFGAEVRDGTLYGRGATDMKGAIACFVAAAARLLEDGGSGFTGSISLVITGDEEGPSINGTAKMLGWMADNGEVPDVCIVGEPTNPTVLGDMIKIGRRGSISGWMTVKGVQGHTAYPHLADNPLPRLMRMLTAITDEPLDQGTEHFQPSNVQIASIDTGNSAPNIIPATARAVFNVRFNDRHTGQSVTQWLKERFDAVGGEYDLEIKVTGEAFLTPPGRLSELISTVIERVTGRKAELSTTGGTSDARFIKDLCPVAEFGLIGQTMHKTDECVAIADLRALTDIYEAVLRSFFKTL